MNATRIRAIEDGQSATAKKVLAAVPIAEAPLDPFDRAAHVIAQMEALLREFGEITLAMQGRIEQARAESAKFRRLQELLRDE